MNIILFIVTVIFIVICIGIYVGFIFSEGKDERGQAIIAKSSQIAFIFVLLGFSFQGLYYHFANPTVEQLIMLIYIWMVFVFGANSISILVLQKKM